MILSREQIDAHAVLRRSMDDDFRNGTYRTDWTSIHALINGTDALVDTGLAYHNLRDAVLMLPIRNYFTEDGIYRGACVDLDALREVVARVERGE